MSLSSIGTLRAKSQSFQSKRRVLIKKLFELEKNLAETFSGIKIRAQSVKFSLDQIGEDEWVYGYLSFYEDAISVAYRDTQDDYADDRSNVPEEYRSYTSKHISLCSVEWIEKVAADKIMTSLIEDLERQLDEMNSLAEKSVATMNKIFEAHAEQINSDALDILSSIGDDSLLKGWSIARALITTEPAESITRSSSYLESVCRKILSDMNVPLPNKKEITNLISECVKAMKLSDDAEADTDLVQLIGGLKGVCQSVGSLRTHFGTAHGYSPGDYQVDEHYARLANNAAATVSSFLLYRHRSNMAKQGRKE